jgi:hypothetical protein
MQSSGGKVWESTAYPKGQKLTRGSTLFWVRKMAQLNLCQFLTLSEAAEEFEDPKEFDLHERLNDLLILRIQNLELLQYPTLYSGSLTLNHNYS